MKTKTFTRHPLSSFFYDMQPEEFESLKNSISKHGVLNPIIIHEDMILDGWHRYKACQELDIECPHVYFTDAYPDTDERDFVIAQNKERKTFYETLSEITGLSDYKDIISCIKNLKEDLSNYRIKTVKGIIS